MATGLLVLRCWFGSDLLGVRRLGAESVSRRLHTNLCSTTGAMLRGFPMGGGTWCHGGQGLRSTSFLR